HGWLTPHWPRDYGGQDSSMWERVVVGEEMWASGEPRGPQYMNVNWIAPAIMLAGTEEQKTRFLPPIARGQVVWCQGFSEPDAGSDLAALRTRAVRDGDVYVVDGQKIWTSYAHGADYCFLLVRTDSSVDFREGISILLMPMDLPGIEVRDIPTPFVDHFLHELFLDGVQVPVDNLLGEENRGWSVVRHALTEERVGIARHACQEQALLEVIDEIESAGGSTEDPAVAESLGMGFAWAEAARSLMYVAVQEQIDDPTGVRPMASVWQAFGPGLAEQAVRDLLMDISGMDGLVENTIADRYTSLGTTGSIAAGTLEVQLNSVARFSLGLPRGS
ncbi:MAG: acyl-CoA dehydrogenase family protein, partial [Actinomycetota bacterium]|nr:acyl-CoA dehydrogenase family protein [Actinomycetota bacterium]